MNAGGSSSQHLWLDVNEFVKVELPKKDSMAAIRTVEGFRRQVQPL